MTVFGSDSLRTCDEITVRGRTYAYYSLPKAAAQLGDVSPFGKADRSRFLSVLDQTVVRLRR